MGKPLMIPVSCESLVGARPRKPRSLIPSEEQRRYSVWRVAVETGGAYPGREPCRLDMLLAYKGFADVSVAMSDSFP